MMQQVTKQLERVRDLGRLLLVSQRVLQWIVGVLLAAVICGLLDYTLRLPGWLRLVIGLIIAGVAIDWLVLRLARALRFRPELSELAQRAERMYPQLGGELASAVEFATHEADFRDPRLTGAMAQASIQRVQSRLGRVSLTRLLDPTRTLRLAVLATVVCAGVAGIVFAAPASSVLALQRWLLPLGSTQWPHRYEVTSLVADKVWPADTPLRVRAQVSRGYRGGLRTWAYTRLITPAGEPGPWQESLMNEQSGAGVRGGGYEAIIDVTAALGASESALANPTGSPGAIELYFQTGDHRTDPQRIDLVHRPSLRAITLQIEPPAYAQGLISPQQVALEQQTGAMATAAATQGSAIRWRLLLNKPIPAAHATLANLLPGMADLQGVRIDSARLDAADGEGPELTVAFRLDQTVQTPIHLMDEHGLGNDSERLYRIESISDKPPAVALVQPRADEAVLPAAVVEVAAVAQDDVAVESLQLQALAPAAAPAPPAQLSSGEVRALTLRDLTGRSSRMTAEHTLDLAPLTLKPGDEVELNAITRDVYVMDNLRHDPVRATPRKLRIIDAATLIGQVRTELAGLRQQVIRLEDQQRQLLKAQPDAAQRPQQQLGERIATQQDLIEAMRGRLQRNRLSEPQLDQVLARAGELLREAQQASDDAAGKLGEAQTPQEHPQAAAEARRAQERADTAMTRLVELLDQGRDALTLQLQLKQLSTMQDTLALDTRQMLPRTMGKSPEQLNDAERKAIQELADRQAALAESARALAQQMQSSSEQMAKQSNDAQNQAAAQALAEAAAIAQRQGLSESMQQASQQTSQNQLSSAGQQQASAQQTLQQMLQQMGQQDRFKQEILRRRLLQLAEALEKLVQRQGGEVDRTKATAGEVAALEPGQSTLRRNTMDVAEQAREGEASKPVAQRMDEAIDGQGQAITSLRQNQRDPALEHQQSALVHLQEALNLVRNMQKQAQEEQQRQKRQDLRELYEKLAKAQEELRQKTQAMKDQGELNRRQRAGLVELGDQQSDLRGEARQLQDQVAESTILFRHMHERIDRAAQGVVGELRAARATAAVVADQAMIASLLRHLAEALAQANEQSEFAQAGGEGGQGGGGGGEPPLVPPIAELRLLRGLQQTVYQRTREVAQQDAASATGEVSQLSLRQRELAALGEELIEAMQRQQQMMAPPAP